MNPPDVEFWCGVAETNWNRQPVTPGGKACISPIYGQKKRYINYIWLPPGTQVIQDSGAFSDACITQTSSSSPPSVPPTTLPFLSLPLSLPLNTDLRLRYGQRLTLEGALCRQEEHAQRFGYTPTFRASYDVLIDESWTALEERGVYERSKKRWSESDAKWAVEETVKAAAFLNNHRNGIPCVLSIQGVSARQYLQCAKGILPYLQDEDYVGLGGWCITGKMPAQIMPVFRETMSILIPFLAQESIKRVHIWGVCYAPALAELRALCDKYGIEEVSTDSVGPNIRPSRGVWGYDDWYDKHYLRCPVHPVDDRPTNDREDLVPVKTWRGETIWIPNNRGKHRIEHVLQTRNWLAHLRQSRHYAKIVAPPHQQPQQLLLAI